jgi:hypothetical protein
MSALQLGQETSPDHGQLIPQILDVYKAAAMDEAAGQEAAAILDRARALIANAASTIFDCPPAARPAGSASAGIGETYASLRTAEVDLHLSLLVLAKHHLADGAWEVAAKHAAVVARAGLLGDEGAALAADALMAGLEAMISAKEYDAKPVDKWVATAQRCLLTELRRPDLLDEILLRGMKVAFETCDTYGDDVDVIRRPLRLEEGVALARAYVALEPQSRRRQGEAGRHIADAIKRYPIRWVVIELVPLLTLPQTKDVEGLVARLEAARSARDLPKPLGIMVESSQMHGWRMRWLDAAARFDSIAEPALAGALLVVPE